MQIVNGYVCMTSCDVSLANKGVDPAHPKDDPNKVDPAKASATADLGKDGKTDPSKTDSTASVNASPAVVFGGVLAQANGPGGATGPSVFSNAGASGQLLDVTA